MFVTIALFVLLSSYLMFLPFSVSLRLICTLFGLSAIAYANQKPINASREHAKLLRRRMRTILIQGPLIQNSMRFLLLFLTSMYWAYASGVLANQPTGDLERQHYFLDPTGAPQLFQRYCTGESQTTCSALLIMVEAAFVVINLATPWILCYDFSEENPLNIHFNNYDEKYKIKIAIAYGIAGTIGLAGGQCLLASIFDTYHHVMNPKEISMHVGNAAAIWTFVNNMEGDLRYIFQLLACQLLLSIAAAEQNVFGKKRTMLIAVLLSAVICLARSFTISVFLIGKFSDAVFRFSSNAWTVFAIGVAFSMYERLLNAANHYV